MSTDTKRLPEQRIKPVMAMARLARARPAAAVATPAWRAEPVAAGEAGTTAFASINGHAQTKIDRRPVA